MKAFISVLVLFCLSLPAISQASISCSGKVTTIYNPINACDVVNDAGQTVSHIAYFNAGVTGTNGVTPVWLCSNSELNDAMIMLAYANNLDVGVRIDGSSCSSQSHYITPQYIVSKPH